MAPGEVDCGELGSETGADVAARCDKVDCRLLTMAGANETAVGGSRKASRINVQLSLDREKKKVLQKNYSFALTDKQVHVLKRPFEWLLLLFVHQQCWVIATIFSNLISLKNL